MLILTPVHSQTARVSVVVRHWISSPEWAQCFNNVICQIYVRNKGSSRKHGMSWVLKLYLFLHPHSSPQSGTRI